MTHFIKDNPALAAAKSDYSVRNVPANQKVAASDWNEVRQALLDIQSYLRDEFVFDVKNFGAKGDGVTDDTAAIQAALDAASAQAGLNGTGVVLVPASASPYMFSNLKISAWTTLQGAHMSRSKLKRIVGSVGTALREKTAAEGNASGAGGLWLKDISIDGNGTAGNGIDLGNQVAANQLNFNAGVERVFVSGFASGVGMILNCNAVRCAYLWANSNQEGIRLQGGGSVIHGVWAEGNSSMDLRLQCANTMVHGIHCEPMAGIVACVQIEGSNNSLLGVNLSLNGNVTDCVRIIVGANRNFIRDVSVMPNAFTFANLVNYQAYGSGATGNVLTMLSEFVMGETNNTAGWYINSSSGNTIRRLGDVFVITGLPSANPGAGTKQLWYDPADGNRVKFAP